MNTLSKLTLISVMISAMAGCSVRKDGNNLSNVTTADSLLFTEPLDTLPDGVISSVSWLPLQNSDQRIIDEISKLSVVDSFIVIGSRRQAVLQVYSTEGKFLYEISEKGQGPEEYLEIATFTVTPTSIYILDNFSHKISRYALEKGTFMGKTEVPFVAWDMGKHSVNHVFLSPTSIINFTSKKQSYDDTRRSSRDNELLQRAQSGL